MVLKMYWVSYVGWHASQGGMDWGYGSSGFTDLDEALSFYKRKYEQAEEHLLRAIKDKKEN